MRRNNEYGLGVLVAVVVVVALALVVGCTAAKYVTTSSVTIHVTDKTAAGGGSNGHKYLIYTDQGTFEDSDNLFHGKFSSSDLYARIHVGHTYQCSVTGFRVPLFSWYRNLISCQEVG